MKRHEMIVFDRDSLKRIRTQNKLSLMAVAKEYGCSYQQYQKWENGKVIPSVVAIGSLANVFGCSPTDFYTTNQKGENK